VAIHSLLFVVSMPVLSQDYWVVGLTAGDPFLGR